LSEVSLITREGAVVVLIGSFFGIIGALMSTRLLASLLYGLGTTDTKTFIVGPALLLLVAFAASWIPASKAVGVNPLEAVRCE
jgi:putative ABC transport system permease protein